VMGEERKCDWRQEMSGKAPRPTTLKSNFIGDELADIISNHILKSIRVPENCGMCLRLTFSQGSLVTLFTPLPHSP
jgi:hypothetical protein